MKAPLTLPPTALDIAVARAITKHASAPLEHAVKPLSFLADEKLVLGAVLVFWAACRGMRRGSRARACADEIAAGAVITAVLPHLIKRLVDRERPDRRVVHGRRHGIPLSGNTWDSFPSGHATHLGVLAAAGSRMTHRRWHPYLWATALALASTRLLLLAHYLTDVIAGLLLGIGVDRVVRRADLTYNRRNREGGAR